MPISSLRFRNHAGRTPLPRFVDACSTLEMITGREENMELLIRRTRDLEITVIELFYGRARITVGQIGDIGYEDAW